MNIIPTDPWENCVQNEVATLTCIPTVLQNIVNFLILFAGVVCVFLVVYAGYKYVMSEGDPEKVASARKTLAYAIAGFLLVLASIVILNLVSQFTGVERLAPQP